MKIPTNFRVCASVDTYTWEKDPEKAARIFARRAEELRAEIKRHCDRFSDVWVESDYECSHCQLSWEVDEKGEPQCCTKAQEEWAAKAGAPTQAA